MDQHKPFNGEAAMRTKEIETEMLLQEMASLRCKFEELNDLVRSYARSLLSREHDVAAWMEATQVARRGSDAK
jgi:hypothetical protein